MYFHLFSNFHRFLFLFILTLYQSFSLKLPSIIFEVSNVRRTRVQPLLAVTEINSVVSADDIIKTAGDNLIVIDYSTTWCGPCKVVLPKFVELSDKYPNVIFLKCIGDSSAEAGALMKREGVRSVPAFHFWKGGSRVEVVNGARIEEVETFVKNAMLNL